MNPILDAERIYLTPLSLSRIKSMTKWGKHKNPLLYDYNFDFSTEYGQRLFYFVKTASPFKKYFAIVDKETDDTIGYLGMKNINFFKKTSVLGIVIDPAKMDMKYGTEALERFFEYYFGYLQMKDMVLEVATYNPRAIKLYRNMGFEKTGYALDEYPNEDLDTSSEEYLKFKEEFLFTNGKWYNYIYTMILTAEKYYSRRGDTIEI
ncbi:MAG: GNAT family protein [Tissierellia bacterium]|nr:GNAT family protein [Tissierellia bacterium]